METGNEPRKIDLDQKVYNVFDHWESGGDRTCNHDFDPKKCRDEDEYATWKCTKCGREVSFGVWE